MELNLNELLKGKATVIRGKEYLSAEAYVTPFLERMSKFTKDFRIQAKLPEKKISTLRILSLIEFGFKQFSQRNLALIIITRL